MAHQQGRHRLLGQVFVIAAATTILSPDRRALLTPWCWPRARRVVPTRPHLYATRICRTPPRSCCRCRTTNMLAPAPRPAVNPICVDGRAVLKKVAEYRSVRLVSAATSTKARAPRR